MYKSHSVGHAYKTSSEFLLQMIRAPYFTQCIYAAAKLGIADLLKDGSKQTYELAALTETHEPSLYRVLRALASVGIFSETQPRCFELTPVAQLLRSDVPDSLRAFSVFFGSDLQYQSLGKILYSVKTGKPAFDHIFNMSFYDYLRQDSIAARIFDDAMASVSNQPASLIATTYDFSKIKSIVDVGGGNGTLLGAILKANPHLKGILFDLPEVIERVRYSEYLTTEISSGRCQLIPGNFFETVPDGADAYIMKCIIHNWNNDQSIKILNNCYKAMAKNGKLLLIEKIVPPGNEPGLAKISDIVMLVKQTGFERTEIEFNTLLQTAGFSKARLFKILTTPLFIFESARTKDLMFRLDQTSESKQEAPIEEPEVRNREVQVASTRKAPLFNPRNELDLDKVKEIKAKSIDVIVKLMEDEKYQEAARLVQAIDCEQWYEAMQTISCLTGRDLPYSTSLSMSFNA